MKTRFYLLAILAGIFLIVALPVGIAFLFFVALYYLASNKVENKANPVDPASPDEDIPTENPDFNSLFNNDDFVNEQEKLR